MWFVKMEESWSDRFHQNICNNCHYPLILLHIKSRLTIYGYIMLLTCFCGPVRQCSGQCLVPVAFKRKDAANTAAILVVIHWTCSGCWSRKTAKTAEWKTMSLAGFICIRSGFDTSEWKMKYKTDTSSRYSQVTERVCATMIAAPAAIYIFQINYVTMDTWKNKHQKEYEYF